jgi:hypothetical protein
MNLKLVISKCNVHDDTLLLRIYIWIVFIWGFSIHLVIHSRERRERLHTTKLPQLDNSNVVIVGLKLCCTNDKIFLPTTQSWSSTLGQDVMFLSGRFDAHSIKLNVMNAIWWWVS